jgi:hypothetical protein
LASGLQDIGTPMGVPAGMQPWVPWVEIVTVPPHIACGVPHVQSVHLRLSLKALPVPPLLLLPLVEGMRFVGNFTV